MSEYSKTLEKIEKLQKEMAQEEAIIAAKTAKKKKRKTLVEKVGVKLKEVFYGGKTYSSKKFPPSRGSAAARGGVSKRHITLATKKVERGLEQAGVSKKKIKQLRD